MPVSSDDEPVRAIERHPWWGTWVHGALPLAFTWLIFVRGSAPAEPDAIQVNDKLAHAVVFMVLALLCGPLAAHVWIRGGRPGTRSLFPFVAACAGYSMFVGAALEVWQAGIPHRTADVWDWVADAVGALVAAFLLSSMLPWYINVRTQNRS